MWTVGRGSEVASRARARSARFPLRYGFNTVYLDNLLILYLFLSSDLLYFITEIAKLQSIVLTYNNNVLGRR